MDAKMLSLQNLGMHWKKYVQITTIITEFDVALRFPKTLWLLGAQREIFINMNNEQQLRKGKADGVVFHFSKM